jgi:hypothetical protein
VVEDALPDDSTKAMPPETDMPEAYPPDPTLTVPLTPAEPLSSLPKSRIEPPPSK